MAQEEIYGLRPPEYSVWHRRNSTRRFVGLEFAQLLSMIDIDVSLYTEYEDGTKEPLALIETAIDRGQNVKPATVTASLARRAELPSFVMLYTLSDQLNPADPRYRDISSFRVKSLTPGPMANDWRVFSPDEWARFLLHLRGLQSNHYDDRDGYFADNIWRRRAAMIQA